MFIYSKKFTNSLGKNTTPHSVFDPLNLTYMYVILFRLGIHVATIETWLDTYVFLHYPGQVSFPIRELLGLAAR